MRAPYTQIFMHLVWATWDRLPLLTPEIRPRVYGCVQEECTRFGVELIAIGGMEDHVHLLARLPAPVSVSSLVKQFKGASSHLVNNEVAKDYPFRWQGGYGAFSVSKSNVPRVRHYILNQEAHHRGGTTFPEVEPQG